MNRTFFLAMSAVAALTVGVTAQSGCTTETKKSSTSSDGGAGGEAGGGPGVGGSGGTGAQGGGGSGGAPACSGCADFFTDATVLPEDLCGFVSNMGGEITCADEPADNSCVLVGELYSCVCAQGGACETDCADFCSGSAAADETCATCAGNSCNAEYNACTLDVEGSG
jgi:hypothetical protein